VNVNEVISSGLLESYVLGTTSADETAMISDLCNKHPELIKEIEWIEEALIHYASKNATPLNTKLKESLQAKLGFSKQAEAGNIIPLKPAAPRLQAYKFGIAASVLLLIGSGLYILSLHQKLEKLHGELAELNTTKRFLVDELKVQQTSLATINQQFQIVSDPNIKTIALSGMNSLLNKKALVYWNSETNEVYFNASSLPAPANKQYQLWAIVNGNPVNAGVIDLQNSSAFQKMNLIKGAGAFAVTIENIGGSATPSLDTMCLLGNV
jgi:anti-sigma-K factor RskA